MNTVSVNDQEFFNSKLYQDFLRDNPKRGFLKIRAFSASQAIPVSGLKVVVSKNIGNNKVVFLEEYSNESGIIEKIELPTPTLNTNDLDVPNSISYDITATYLPDNASGIYKVNMYEDIYVVQNINVVPNMNVKMGGY